MTAPLPVRDFTGCTNPEAEMKRHYKEALARMMTPRVVPTIIPPPNRAVTVVCAAEARKRFLAQSRTERLAGLKILQAARIVAAVSSISVEDIKGSERLAPMVKARHIAMYIASRNGRTWFSVGYYLGGRDHSTVFHARHAVTPIARRLHLDRCHDAVEIAQRLWDADWDVVKSAEAADVVASS